MSPADPMLRQLLARLLSFADVPERWSVPDIGPEPASDLSLGLMIGNEPIALNSVLTTLVGTDPILAEFRIELFFPADAATEDLLRRATN